jgi:hypothetical protein
MKTIDIVKSDNIGGTHLHGHINHSYADLVRVLGEPHQTFTPETGDKVDVEWGFKFPDGSVFTVYNWKDGKAYCGEEGEEVEDITDWHIGAHKQSTYDAVIDMLNIKLGE